MCQGSGVCSELGVGRRYGLDPVLLWLWYRLAAVAPIGPLAWELPYATSAALKIIINQSINQSMPVMKWDII